MLLEDDLLLIYLNLIDTDEEKSKFEKLYYKYRNLMFFVAKEILGDDSLAEDAVQEAFLRAAKNFSKIGKIDCHQTKNFLVIIVKNIALTMIGKILPETDDSILEYFPVSDNGFSDFNYREMVKKICEMPEMYRDIMYLQCVCEYSFDDISGYLGISVNAAKKRAQRGRTILRMLLKGESDE